MSSEPVLRLIAIGETMVLVTPTTADPLATASSFHLDVGGAESNVASHMAHLGVPTAWVSAVGDDPLGRRLRATIESRGVDTRWVVMNPEASTGVYFKDPGKSVLYYRRDSAASRMGPASVTNVPLEDAAVVHLSGITPALSSGCAALVETVYQRVAASDALMSFDVNYRSTLWSLDIAASTLQSLARRADVVFIGLDEAHTLWGCETAEDVRTLLSEPDKLIVKDGGVGATEFHGDRHVTVPAIPTEVVEAVGAGDAFAAGYLTATIDGAAASDRLLAGHNRARLVLQSTSDYIFETSMQEG